MIGPQAYENLFQTTVLFPTSGYVLQTDGKRYTYYADWEFFDSLSEFKTWCKEDVLNTGGKYADKIEEINLGYLKETTNGDGDEQ
jgi:hypothetical protein